MNTVRVPNPPKNKILQNWARHMYLGLLQHHWRKLGGEKLCSPNEFR